MIGFRTAALIAAALVGLAGWAGPAPAGDWSWRRIMEVGDQITIELPPGPYLAELRPAPGADCVNVHFRFDDAAGDPVRGFRGTPCPGEERRATIEAAPGGRAIRQATIQCSAGPAEAVLKQVGPRSEDQAGGDR